MRRETTLDVLHKMILKVLLHQCEKNIAGTDKSQITLQHSSRCMIADILKIRINKPNAKNFGNVV